VEKAEKRGWGLQLTELVCRQLESGVYPPVNQRKGEGEGEGKKKKKRWTQDVQLIASPSMNLL
jgi:hypothetical protein